MEKLINATHHIIEGEEIKIIELFLEDTSTKVDEMKYRVMGRSGSYAPWNNVKGLPKFTCTIKSRTKYSSLYLHVMKKKYRLVRYSNSDCGTFLPEKGMRGIFEFSRGCLHITIYEGNLLPSKFVKWMNSDNEDYCAFVEKSNEKLHLNKNSILF